MSKGQKPRRPEGAEKKLHANYLSVKCGQTEAGYIAGELYGCNGHRTFAHQPCLSLMTETELQCPYCAAGLIPEWRGYVPLWDRDWVLRYVLIGEELFESVDIIPHRAQVKITRAKNPISPLVVRQETMLTRPLPDDEKFRVAVDMLAICLTLWKCDALTQWFRRNPPKKAELPKGTAVRPNGQPFSPYMQAAAKKVGCEVVSDDTDNVLAKTLKKTREREAKLTESSNGKP